MKWWLLGALMLSSWLLPEVAWACPSCVDPRETNRVAYLVTTALLSVIPLGSVGALVWWLRRRLREQDAQERASRSASLPLNP